MKKINIFLFVAILAIVNSCVLNSGEEVSKKTRAGEFIWQNTSGTISHILFTTDYALKFDLWNEAPADQKSQYDQRYFPNTKVVTQHANIWSFLNLPLYIYPSDKSLHTPGAVWRVMYSNNDYYYNSPFPKIHTTIECIGEKEWRVTTYNGDGINENIEFQLELKGSEMDIISTSAAYIYSVKGSGSFKPFSSYSYSGNQEELLIDFTIPSNMTFHPFNHPGKNFYLHDIVYTYRAYLGNCNIFISKDITSSSLDNVIVDILSGSAYKIVYRITYNGVSEVWEMF